MPPKPASQTSINTPSRFKQTDFKPPSSAQIKAEADAHYARRDYASAHLKYSSAIQTDDKNAILYCNRSACCLQMHRYKDAAEDAKKATELNPGYSKAWGRLGKALYIMNHLDMSINAWQRALETIAKDNLSSAEIRSKIEYQEGLADAEKLLRESPLASVQSDLKDQPWELARGLKAEVMTDDPDKRVSSAWVIWQAYDDYSLGLKHLDQLKEVKGPGRNHPGDGQNTEGVGEAEERRFSGPDPVLKMGNAMAITELTNGILRDSRVFHVGSKGWGEKLDDQVKFENRSVEGWATISDANVVIEMIQERLMTRSIDGVRPAITITIRIWILLGRAECFRGRYSQSLELYERVLKLLDWGNRELDYMSAQEKGAVFRRTFVRGVRTMRLETLMLAYVAQTLGAKIDLSIDTFSKEADIVLRDTEEDKPEPEALSDQGFLYSFFCYPRGMAYFLKGFCHDARVAKILEDPDCKQNPQVTFPQILQESSLAVKNYLEAAYWYPPDDELHVVVLRCAIISAWTTAPTVKWMLDIMKRLRVAMPPVYRIWRSSARAKAGDHEEVERAYSQENEILLKVRNGELTLEDRIMLRSGEITKLK